VSKYDALWRYVAACGASSLSLTFADIEAIAGLPIDHAFLTYKKELSSYGWRVEKISLKNRNVLFIKET